ncbi:ydr124wp-like protein [Colletotrichum higginsianum]|nr:ydr124wp-like protein [Colletotrichum higginsianum]
MVQEFHREPYPRQWHSERFTIDPPPPEDGRYHESRDARRPPIDIEKALRDHCNIPAKKFFMVAVLDDGSTEVFGNTGERHQPNGYSKFFSLKNFVRHVNHSLGGYGPRTQDRRRLGGDVFDEDNSYKTRKRHRAGMGAGYRRAANDDDDVAIVVTSNTKKTLKVGDHKEVWNLYEQRFKNCQQTACKLIAKAWVKVVEPKKQTNHPYTGQDEKAPDWWPKPWGPTKEEKVRHKEPDHLYKRGKVK